jgi:hypothetical protein
MVTFQNPGYRTTTVTVTIHHAISTPAQFSGTLESETLELQGTDYIGYRFVINKLESIG